MDFVKVVTGAIDVVSPISGAATKATAKEIVEKSEFGETTANVSQLNYLMPSSLFGWVLVIYAVYLAMQCKAPNHMLVPNVAIAICCPFYYIIYRTLITKCTV